MVARNFVYYDTFALGESGDHGDWAVGYKLFRGILIWNGTWSGRNAIRNIDSTLGPRPGLKKISLGAFSTTIASGSNGATLPQATIHVASTAGSAAIGTFTVDTDVVSYTGKTSTTFTGCTGGTATLATSDAVTQSAFPTGAVLGYGLTQFPGRTGWAVVGTTLYGFDNEAGGAPFAYTGSFDATPTAMVVGIQSGPTFLYLTSQGDGTYVANINTGTLTKMANAPGGRVINIYNTRLVVADMGGVNTNRVAFSDPYSPGGGAEQFTWDAGGTNIATTIAAGSNGVGLPTATIDVASTDGLAAAGLTSGTITVTTGAGPQTVTYTSITGGGTPSLNGCSGGTGTMSTGGAVTTAVLDYFDLGDAWDVNAIAIQRTHMLIGKDNGWYLYQGEPGLNASLRIALDTTPGPKEPNHVLVTQTGLMWYIPLFHDTPTEFTGSAIAQMRHLHVGGDKYEESVFPQKPIYGGAPMGQTTDFMFVGSSDVTNTPNFGVGMHNGAWFYHQFGVNISGYVAHASDRFYICDGGAGGVAAKFYVMLTDLDRPVLSSDGLGSWGDDSTTMLPVHVELPEWESRDGSESTVRAVVVSFRKWNTGSTQSNHFDLTVVSTSQFNKEAVAGVLDVPSGQESKTQSWDEDPALATSPGMYDQVVLRFGDASTGNGFKMSLDNLRGVTIRKIQVIMDIQQTRM